MTIAGLALRSLIHYRRTNVVVALGVASAVAVLAGSLLVGASVRNSLQSIAAARLGATSAVVANAAPFPDALAGRVAAAAAGARVVPVLALSGSVRSERSSRRAGSVAVYGVDDRFFAMHGVKAPPLGRNDAWLSADLAAELATSAGDAAVIRIARPTDIPLDSLQGRREDAGRSLRLTVQGVLSAEQMGDFSLAPSQAPVRSVFVALERLQRDLDLEGRANTLLIAGETLTPARLHEALRAAVTIEDLGLKGIGDVPVFHKPELGELARPVENRYVPQILESRSGLIPDAVAAPLIKLAADTGAGATPVLTWLATRMIAAGGTVPYSLVSAIGPDADGDAEVARLLATSSEPPPIVLNEWAARELHAVAGTAVNLEYFRWADSGQLVTEHSTFRVAGVMPMQGLGIDQHLAPDYPGITSARDFSDWDPPFPIDLGLVRPQDEAYWHQYRTAPKAFIPLAAGQALWHSRYGQLTSIRFHGDVPAARIVAAIDPGDAGFSVVDVRRQSDAASAGATDFGAYFSYFSAFLMASALLLSALFFRLNIEQRVPQIGVLRAAGFSLAHVRRALLIEGLVVALSGAVAGAALAVGWAWLMMFALRTWWVGAVGTTSLRLHVEPSDLAIGAAGATTAAVLAILWTVRSLSRSTPRAQLAGSHGEPPSAARAKGRALASLAITAAVVLSVLSFEKWIAPAGGFFGAGALILIGGLAWFRFRIGGDTSSRQPDRQLSSVIALALRNASWRPGRSVTVAGLVAAAVFLLVAVDAFRKNAGPVSERDSGTGGFALMAESAVPIVHDLQTREGREAVGLADAPANAMAGVDLFGLRLRPGDDASCLNLYQPRRPRIAGVPDRLIREARFRFGATIATGDAGRSNPWTLLGPADRDGVVPAIVDATSLEYVLHAGVGDTITVDADTSHPLRLRIVAALADSVLQGEVLIAESAFQTAFPEIAGYRLFLVSVTAPTPERIGAVSASLESALEPFGFDAQETARRLEAFHRVENTYLSTFQALGGLGLLLGCAGLVAVVLRNVLERRRELALLGAAGFTGRDLHTLIGIEHAALVGVGLAIGVAAAAVAVTPIMIARGGGAPWHALAWTLPVAAAGLLAAFGATRSLRRMALVPSLRSE